MKQYLWRAVNGHFVPFLPVISWNFIRLEWKFSSAIINYRATRTGNTKMYNNLWYLTDSIQRRNNSSLEKATPNIQATKGGNISYQRNISKIFSFETCRTVNLFIFFPSLRFSKNRRRSRREVEERARELRKPRRAAVSLASMQLCHLRAFSRNWFMPLTGRRGHCARPACVVVHSNKLTTGGPAPRIVAPLNNPRGEKGEKWRCASARCPGKKWRKGRSTIPLCLMMDLLELVNL